MFGGRRHLGLAAPLIRGAARPWPSPFDGAADEVLAHRGRQICVLASGDPFHYGVGPVLASRIDPREMIALPAPSAFSLAAARLGWSLPQTTLLSVHGRAPDLIRPHLQPGARILALTSDGDGPATLARLLTDRASARRRSSCWKRSAGRASAFAARGRRRSISARSMRSTPWRSRSPRRRERASSRALPASPTVCSSMTARSPNGKSARSRCRRWRRAVANCCGTSAPAQARSRSNGCWPIRR